MECNLTTQYKTIRYSIDSAPWKLNVSTAKMIRSVLMERSWLFCIFVVIRCTVLMCEALLCWGIVMLEVFKHSMDYKFDGQLHYGYEPILRVIFHMPVYWVAVLFIKALLILTSMCLDVLLHLYCCILFGFIKAAVRDIFLLCFVWDSKTSWFVYLLDWYLSLDVLWLSEQKRRGGGKDAGNAELLGMIMDGDEWWWIEMNSDSEWGDLTCIISLCFLSFYWHLFGFNAMIP